MSDEYDYDLDALVVEAENAPPFRFKWRGEVWEMPLMMAMPFSDQLALEDATVDASNVPGTHDLEDGRYICSASAIASTAT